VDIATLEVGDSLLTMLIDLLDSLLVGFDYCSKLSEQSRQLDEGLFNVLDIIVSSSDAGQDRGRLSRSIGFELLGHQSIAHSNL
jgi:hypothetical protein